MHHWSQLIPREGFNVLGGTEQAQLATLMLAPNEQTGGPDNRHPSSDQWVHVLAGEGRAVVGGEEAVSLGPGSLLLIEAGEAHEIRNLGDSPLEMLMLYTPPAY